MRLYRVKYFSGELIDKKLNWVGVENSLFIVKINYFYLFFGNVFFDLIGRKEKKIWFNLVGIFGLILGECVCYYVGDVCLF